MPSKIDLNSDANLVVYGLTEWKSRDGKKSGTTWTRVGRAFNNRDGSLQIYLDFAPMHGQALQVRPYEAQQGGGGKSPESGGAPPADGEDIPF